MRSSVGTAALLAQQHWAAPECVRRCHVRCMHKDSCLLTKTGIVLAQQHASCNVLFGQQRGSQRNFVSP